MSKKSVTIIPATINRFNASPINDLRKRKVAAYARVSTDKDEQLTSYEAQVDYYTNYIKSRDDWEFAGIYTDEGISATSTAKREGFKQMVADALEGKFGLIVTKSVSRFARNTVDSLTTVRQLKEKGCEVWFEKENIFTLDSKGELLITIMSSLAQEESRSISENCTWGQRKRFADGKVCVPYSRFLGYDKGEDGVLKINKEEAVIVRRIYAMFLEGLTPHAIAKTLTAEKIPTPGGKETWSQSTIKSILSNEKHSGSARLQKSFTTDFLTKKKKINEGELPQFFIEDSHEAIIEPTVFDMVQQEMARRKPGKNRHSGVGMFSSKIKCGSCAAWYGSKVWHSNTKYRRTIWQCNSKFKNVEKCTTPHLDEETIKTLFVSAVNKLLTEKDEIIANLAITRDTLFATASLEAEAKALQSETAITAELTQKCIDENARTALDQSEYQEHYNRLAERYNTAKTKFDEVSEQITQRKVRSEMMDGFIAELQKQEGLIAEFDERLWHSLLDFATVYGEDDVKFTFKDGSKIQA